MRRILLTSLSLALVAGPILAQQKPLKLYISADMEGISGVVSRQQPLR